MVSVADRAWVIEEKWAGIVRSIGRDCLDELSSHGEKPDHLQEG